VRRIHKNKTARLIAASMEMGAVAGGAGPGARARIREAGATAGEAFQIADDILDGEKDTETLGKTPGKDARSDKLTFPSVVGVEKSREEAALLVASAGSILTGGPAPADREASSRLLALFTYLVERGA
jgi:geranylgeranyl pyrophosphate synthase